MGRQVRNVPEHAGEIPGGAPGHCRSRPAVVFSATDCNSLHFANYAGQAYPARLDHLMARDPGDRIRVIGSGLSFVEPVRLNEDTTAELSDHYGVWTDLAVLPRRR